MGVELDGWRFPQPVLGVLLMFIVEVALIACLVAFVGGIVMGIFL